MDGQGDGDHNGPNRHHINIPTEDQPPNGDNNDMEFIFLLHFIIHHHIRVFRQNQIGFVHEHIVNVHIENPVDVYVIEENEENEHQSDNDFEAEEQRVANQEDEDDEEEEPQPGPSRKRSREESEHEEETRIRNHSRWWHEFDNTSDSSGDLDNDEEPLLDRSGGRSTDQLDSEDTESLKSVHEHAKNCSDVAEEGAGSTDSEDINGHEVTKNSLPGTSETQSTDKARHHFKTKGKKYFQWWNGVEDNSSDSGNELDVEENPLPGASETKSRDESESVEEKEENNLRLHNDVSSMPNCVHQMARNIRDTDLIEEGQGSMDDQSCSAQEAEEHPGPGTSNIR
ncbi:uncharacterized protein LOC144017092 isoform X2 [Festucalex cinctus]